MPIIETINDPWHFANWIKNSDNYKNNFSVEGAKAVQEYFEDYSETIEEPIEFDPIAWCCGFSEYESIAEAYKEHYGNDSDLPIEQRRTTEEQQLEYFEDNTTVMQLDNGGIVIADF